MTDPQLFTGLDVPAILPNDDTARARRTDPITSHEAADSNSPESHRLVEDTVFGRLLEKPSTDAELTEWYFSTPGLPVTHFDSVRKRRSDLAKKGLVVKTNLTRLTPSGRSAVVWGVAL